MDLAIMKCNLKNYRKTGFTIVEILIALFILQLFIAPIYLVFSGSKQTMNRAREISIASELASSMLTSIRSVDIKLLKNQKLEQDISLTNPYSLNSLMISQTPKNFSRFMEVKKVDITGREGGPFFMVSVNVSWKKPSMGKKLTYSACALLKGKL